MDKEANKKNALSDEQKTKLNYITEFLLQNGMEYKGNNSSIWFLVGAEGEALYFEVGNNGLRLTAARWGKKIVPVIYYTIRGNKTPNEDPEGVLEVAKNLGVFNDWEEN